MKKQIVIMLLMALAAVMLMTVACGSSDDATDPPGTTRSGTDTSEPAPNTDNTNQTNDQESTTQDPEDNRPRVINTPQLQGENTTPWPTPVPTRNKPSQETSGPETTPANPSPQTTEDNTTNNSTAPLRIQDSHPTYDGASPLIHIFFDQPWLIMPAIEGQTLKPDLKGVTTDGAIVSIENPSQWGITFEDGPYLIYPHLQDEVTPLIIGPDGTITLQDTSKRTRFFTADHNGTRTTIKFYHHSMDDRMITDHRSWVTWTETHRPPAECVYAFQEYTNVDVIYPGSAIVTTSTQEALDAVHEEARKLGYEPIPLDDYPRELGIPTPTFTHLRPPTDDCIPIEEAYRIAREINKIPGTHMLAWTTIKRSIWLGFLDRLFQDNEN